MFPPFRVLSLLWPTGLFLSATHAASDLESRFEQRVRPLLATYCLDCHDTETRKGDVDLSAFGRLDRLEDEFPHWQTVLQQIEEEEMPPKAPLPAPAEREELLAWVREALGTIDWSRHRGIARVTLPRLTKAEYNHTLRDLLGVDLRPGDRLLDDGPGLSGFTNDRDALFISPALAEQYFDAAEATLQAILDLDGEALDRRFEAEDMLMTERGSKPEELPGGGFGYSLAGAGQRTLYDEVILPADGCYRFTVRAVGIGGDSGLRLRIDNEPRQDFFCQDSQPEELAVELLLRGGTHQMTWNIELPPELRKRNEEATRRRPKPGPGAATAPPLPANAAELVSAACTTNTPVLSLPPGATPEAEALVRRLNAALGGMQRRIEYLRLVTPQGNPNDLRTYYNLLPERTQVMAEIKGQLAAALGVPAAEIDRRLTEANRDRLASNDQVLADSLPVLGLPHDSAFLLGNASPEPLRRVGAPGIDWIRVEGPLLPAGARPDSVAALFPLDARAALASFLPRAFRRPLRDGELDRHLALYQDARKNGEPHRQALKLAYTAALTSPRFLFRDELGTGPEAFPLDDHQLANRLSYFLWMTMPDEELRTLADAGNLRDDATLRTQTRRLLADPKARAFTATFLGQWLGFAGLGSEHVPDGRKFRDFTPALADAMKLEPVLVFEDLLRTGGSLTRLLDGKETFANNALAAWYGLPGSDGSDFRPVSHVQDERGGLLGMAAILTASSTPNRTSPVLRGKWVLETLLGRHLAEPPADAGQLDDRAGERGKTLREELAAHRRQESCAACHDKIDPIGFGLEPFDAIGRLRDQEAGRPVDAAGQLPGGVPFTGPGELRDLLATRHRDEFLAHLTRRLASFALGRPLRPRDEGLVRLLLADLEASGHRADVLVESIVLSEAFRTQGGRDD